MTPTRKTNSITDLFSGRKAKWLPLYRRLIARSKDLARLEAQVLKESIRLGEVATVRVLLSGLELVIQLRTSPKSKRNKMKRKIKLAALNQIDDDLLTWIRTASVMASSRQ